MSIFQNKKLLLLISIPLILLIIGGGYYLWSRNRYDPEEYEGLLDQANESYEELKYSDALDRYLEASELAPRQFEAYKMIVTILSEKGLFTDATSVVEGVIVHLEPTDYAELWRVLGAGYQSDRLFDKAAECFEQSYKYSKSEDDLVKIIDLSIRAGEIEKITEYIDLVETDSESVIVMWNEYKGLLSDETELLEVVTAARGYISDGYPYLAKKLLEAHDEDMENYWEGKYYLGRAHFDLGEYESASVYFDQAISLGSDDPTLYIYIARVSDLLLEKNSAYNYYDRAVSFAKEDQFYDFVSEYFELLLSDEQYNRAEDLLTAHDQYIWTEVMQLSLYDAREDHESFKVTLDELDQEKVPTYQLMEYLKLVAQYYLYVDVDLEKASELIHMMDDSSWSLLYQGMLKIEEKKVEEGKELLNAAIDADLEGEVTAIAEKLVENN